MRNMEGRGGCLRIGAWGSYFISGNVARRTEATCTINKMFDYFFNQCLSRLFLKPPRPWC